jgi:hypothetical protein
MARIFIAGWMLYGIATFSAPAATFNATFNKDVLPILQGHCQSCHRPGEVAPMSLLSYESARPWAKAIKAALLTGKMPPWPADRHYGKFLNDPVLTQSEIDTLVDWADHGAPEGDPNDKPAAIAWPEDWHIRPDMVITLPESPPIPAKGVVELMDVKLPSGFEQDTWITSIEIRPGNRSVVHHVLLEVEAHSPKAVYGEWNWDEPKRDADGAARKRIKRNDRLRGIAGAEAVWLPGSLPADYRPYDAAKLIPAGSDFLIQMHYTPNGAATTDRTRIAFTLAKGEPKRRFLTLNPTALRDAAHFRIPAGDPDWETATEIVFNDDVQIVSFLPHMHLRGKDMTYRLLRPDGPPETLLSLKWDFAWQLAYTAAQPIAVTRGTRLEVIAHFDNSPNNPLNPNPNREVWWGDQTWEEMMVPWVGVLTAPDADPERVVTYPREFSSGKLARKHAPAPKAGSSHSPTP